MAIEAIQYGLATETFRSSTTAPTTGSTFALPARSANRLSYVLVGQTITSLNLVHEVSNDNVNFKTLATDSGSTGTIGSIELSYSFYRNRIVAGTGAGTVSVTVTVGRF